MPNSSRLQWPYPGENQDPWYNSFESLIAAQDASGYASREDHQIMMGGGGLVSWNSATGVLSWLAPFEVYSSISGFRFSVASGTAAIADGQVIYITLTRAPSVNATASFVVASSVPNTDDAYVVGIRRGTDVYFRFGSKIANGETKDLFQNSGAAGTDIVERAATFSVAEGSSTQEATLGRVIYAGSLVGAAAEITQPVASLGSVTVRVKVGGVTKLSLVLDQTSPSAVYATVASGTHALVPGDALSVEAQADGYANEAGETAGLTVSVAMLVGLFTEPADIPISSTTQKGIIKVSAAPADPTQPIAYGANDTAVARLDTAQTFTKAQGVALVTLTDAATIAVDGSLGNCYKLVLVGDRTLGNPTNLVAGHIYTFIIEQDETGSWLLSWGSNWCFADAGTPPTLSTGAGTRDILSVVTDGTRMLVYNAALDVR